MDKNAIWKWLILVLLLCMSIWVVSPPSEKIRPGIDIQGGTSLTVEIDATKVREEIRNRLDGAAGKPDEEMTQDELDAEETEVQEILKEAPERTIEVIRNRINSLGIEEPVIYLGQNGRIIVQLPGIGEEKLNRAIDSIKKIAFLEFRLVHKSNEAVAAALFQKGLAPDGFKIVPGKKLYYKDPQFKKSMDGAFRKKLGMFEIPDAKYEFMLKKDVESGQVVYRPFYVERRSQLKGDRLKNAVVGYGTMNQPQVNIEFDGKGAKAFARITEDYGPNGPMNAESDIGRQLAIVLDGTLYSAPVIRQPIYGGRAEITGNFRLEEARLLANVMRSGALPAPVKIVEKYFVSPSLGRDSIDSGISAVLYGGIGVVVFMVVYYLACGVIADLALLLNMLLLPLGMIVVAGFLSLGVKTGAGGSAIQLPVLTLPGIAGILLTIGMAVDANVLIFERIREEAKKNKTLWTTITDGYDKAFVTIIDANLTTLLTGIILFRFGSGPIRGFAVTLCAGILVSMFTALVAAKLFFGVIASWTKSMDVVKMFSIVKSTSIDFIKARKVAALISVVVIVGSCGWMGFRASKVPSSVFAVDFMGGTSLTFSVDKAMPLSEFQEKYPIDAIRGSLEKAGVVEPFIQYQREISDPDSGTLQVRAGADLIDGKKAGEVAEQALKADHPDAKFDLAQEYEIESQIGDELKKDAVWSIVLALLGIIIYISVRFQFGFALGAIVALGHDVLVTVGIYSLCGRQLSLPIVAALLTIVGYSVNDTIVVSDRIREYLKEKKKESFRDICNLGINHTLGRTLLTSFTTLITVVMLLVFGGGAINDFALALCIGVLVGTYSSIFVATPVVLAWYKNRKPDFATAVK